MRTLQEYLRHRKIRRQAHDCIQFARHTLRMREDLLSEDERLATETCINEVKTLVQTKQWDAVEKACQTLRQQTVAISGNRIKNSIGENLEMLIVAVAVAMGLRAYFLQPFKIPTGSMQPTLNGITAITTDAVWSDKQPFKTVRLVLRGEWYREVHARASGQLGKPMEHPRDPSIVLFRIGGSIHRIPRDVLEMNSEGNLLPPYHAERVVGQGELLWAGRTQRGDHLFVNKVIWNFRKPRRDEVMVFTTDGIPSLEPGTHYIKRLVGKPNERVAIRPPNLYVDGAPVIGYRGIDRVTAAHEDYAGFQLAGHLHSPNLEWRMGEGEYFALGDNTQNSRDSRYWGPVPQKNLVGPAVFVYWPITSRWGLIR